MKKFYIIVTCFLLCHSLSFAATILPSLGKTFEIAEPNALEEIQRRVAERGAAITTQLKENARESFKTYQPSNMAQLPPAPQDRIRDVDLTWVLPYDILNKDGDILYPEGFTVNPTDFVYWRKRMIVIDGTDPAQVRWLIKSGMHLDPLSMILLSDGSYIDMMKELGTKVFYLDTTIKDRFQLQYVPSVVVQNQKNFRVAEFIVPEWIKGESNEN